MPSAKKALIVLATLLIVVHLRNFFIYDDESISSYVLGCISMGFIIALMFISKT
jgi:hypothetical protein